MIGIEIMVDLQHFVQVIFVFNNRVEDIAFCKFHSGCGTGYEDTCLFEILFYTLVGFLHLRKPANREALYNNGEYHHIISNREEKVMMQMVVNR